MNKKLSHHKLAASLFAVALASFGLGMLLHFGGALTFLESKTYDNRINVTGAFAQPSQDIVFVGIDQSSLDEGFACKGWSWPWPREAYADIIEFMNLGNAQSVAFDVLYTEPSIYGAADDETLVKAASDYGRAIFVMSSTENAGTTFPIERIRNSAGMIANVTSIKDSDGVIRRARIAFEYEGTRFPTLGVAPALLDSDDVQGDISRLYDTLPLDKNGAVRLRYKGSIDRYAHYRAIDIIKSLDAVKAGTEPVIEPENFEGATVFFLFYAPGLYDICSTPVSEMYPGAGCHITLLDNLLEDGFIRELPSWLVILYIALWTALSALIVYSSETAFFQSRTAFLMGCGTAGILLVSAIGYILFAKGLYIPIVAPVFCFGAALWTGMLAAHSIEGKQKKFIQGAFSQYLSPSVIENLIANPQSLKLGGERRNLSIFFSDIQGFTTISESLEPEQLTELLNKYLTAMTDTILASGGTIDKYEGDAIIAFWNAPTDEPDHARRAVETSLLCQQKIEAMKDEFSAVAGRPLLTRIGLNTGDVIVGNMGSSHRFDYTMLGDAVNLASRLEGINKQFGTYLMCSKETKEKAERDGTQLKFRELSRVAVVGKSQAVTVYEPMMPEVYEAKKQILTAFSGALDLFYKGDFAQAKAAFDTIAKQDAPAAKYSVKCAELLQSPPEGAWKGVWVATSK